jgi:hypothetical protein
MFTCLQEAAARQKTISKFPIDFAAIAEKKLLISIMFVKYCRDDHIHVSHEAFLVAFISPHCGYYVLCRISYMNEIPGLAVFFAASISGSSA